MAVFKFRRTIEVSVVLLDVGKVDVETVEVAFKDEAAQRESAEEWIRCMEDDLNEPEDFVHIDGDYFVHIDSDSGWEPVAAAKGE